MAGVAPEGVVIASVLPVIEPNAPIVPVTVAPETLVVNTPETPVTLLNCAVLPVIVAPDSWVVNTPLTPLNVARHLS